MNIVCINLTAMGLGYSIGLLWNDHRMESCILMAVLLIIIIVNLISKLEVTKKEKTKGEGS